MADLPDLSEEQEVPDESDAQAPPNVPQLTKLKDHFAELSLTKKMLVMMGLAGGFAVIAVLWLWTQKPEFKVVYSNLSPEDAGAIVEKLKEMKVPYEFSGRGSAILVPAEKVHELRLQLANQGLPHGGEVGFEIFDQSALGTTEYAQKLNFRRALQGELARTITQLDEVIKARVHLVIPEKSLFSEQQQEARAAVVLSLRPGRQLSRTQIEGITHLVSGSVEGLGTNAVTVVDSKGQIKTKDPEEYSSFQQSRSQLEYQKKLDQKLQNKIETILTRVVGPNKAVVRVSSTLDFRQVELTAERFDPETQVARSKQSSQEQSRGKSQSQPPGGVPGVASNIPAGTPAERGEKTDENSSQTTNEVINYEISKTVSRVVEPFGKITRLSVAVLIDGSYESVTDEEGVTTQKYIPRSEADMEKLTGIVKKTMGYSSDREDQVEVVNIPFEAAPDGDLGAIPESTADKIKRWLPVVRQITGPMMILLIIFFVTRPIIKFLVTPPPQLVPLPAGSAEGLSAQALSDGTSETRDGADTDAEPSQLEGKEQGLLTGEGVSESESDVLSREDIVKIAEENPIAASQLVKQWVEEA